MDVVERYVYDPYGRVRIYDEAWTSELSWSGSKKNEILYCGYRFDPESGLYHVRNRMYHPTLGRWLQRDPAGYVDGLNLYEYVRSWPCTLTDATGLFDQGYDPTEPIGIWPPEMPWDPGKPGYPGDPGASHWETIDFIIHYIGRSGKPVDLKDIGLFELWRKWVANDIANLAQKARNKAFTKGFRMGVSCSNPSVAVSGSVSDDTWTPSGEGYPTPLLLIMPIFDPLFSVGAGRLHIDYTGTITAECKECCDGSTRVVRYVAELALSFHYRDEFSNPFGIGGPFHPKGPGTDILGTPYPITADWTERVTSIHKAGGCP